MATEVNRCPYCHDDVSASEADWLACLRCLARHHRECWAESRRCASCSCVESVVPARRRRPVVALVAALAVVGAGGAAAAMALSARSSERGPATSWEGVPPGSTYRVRHDKGSQSTIEETTLLSRTSYSAKVKKSGIIGTAYEEGLVEPLVDRRWARFEDDPGRARVSLEVPAGRFECEHYSGPARESLKGKGWRLDVYVAPSVPLPIKVAWTSDQGVESWTLIEIRKP